MDHFYRFQKVSFSHKKGVDTFIARLYPTCQVVSDSKLNVEHDAHIHFAQKPREMP